KENVRSLQRRQAGALRIPLIPADQHTDAAEMGIERPETEVARGEVILLEIEGIVGDVHLAVEAAQTAIRVEDDRAVVIHPGGAPLEQRRHHHRAGLPRYLRKALGRRARNRFRQVKEPGILRLTEITSAKELLQTNDLSSGVGGLPDAVDRFVQIGGWFRATSHLDQSQGHAARWWRCHLRSLLDRTVQRNSFRSPSCKLNPA